MALDKQKAALLKTVYTGFSKAYYSAVGNPKKYGIRLTKDAAALHRKAFPNEPVPGEPEKQKEKRKLGDVLSFRTTRKRKREILKALEEDGFSKAQDGLSWVIEMYMIRRENEDSPV